MPYTIRIREDGMVKKKAVYCAIGLDLEGQKDVLGFLHRRK